MMRRYKRLVVLQPDFDRLRHEFVQGEPSYGRLFAHIGNQYAEKLGKPRWGDKSLNTERYADAIFSAYPTAKFIHILRDPRDRYASALSRWKVNRGGAGAGIAIWLASVHFAERNLKRYPDRYRIIRYETLVYQPSETLQEICEFLDEDFDPVMLSMSGAETLLEKGGNSSYERREPGKISTSSIGRFRKVLSPRGIAFMQGVAWREMLSYGYELDPVNLPFTERVLYSCFDWPVNLARFFGWRIVERIKDRRGRTVPDYRIVTENNPIHVNA